MFNGATQPVKYSVTLPVKYGNATCLIVQPNALNTQPNALA